MRNIFLVLVLASSVSLRAQTTRPLSPVYYMGAGAFTPFHPWGNGIPSNQKWSLQKYAGVSAGLGYFNSGYTTMMSVPVGLQLNRRLTNNLYAFAGISAAPAIYNFNSSFIRSDINTYHGGINGFNNSSVGMYSKFETGLMYINDDRTFSISGSISVSRGTYPAYPYYLGNPMPNQPVSNNVRH